MMLPVDISLRVLEASRPEAWKSWILANPHLSTLISAEAGFWRQQCHLRGYPGHSLTHYKHSHQTRQNWLRGKYQRKNIPTSGHICYFLDGRRNRALSATLPAPECHFWDLETGRMILKGEGGVSCASLEGELLACGSRDGRLTVLDTREGKVHRSMVAHHGEISVVELKNDTLVTGSTDGTVKVWDAHSLGEVSSETVGQSITGVTISKGATPQIAYATSSGIARLMGGGAGAGGGQGHTIDVTEGGAINCMRFRGSDVIVGSDDGNIRLCTAGGVELIQSDTDSPVVTLHSHRGRVVAGHSNGLITCHQVQPHRPPSEPLWIAEDRGIIWKIYNDQERILSSSLDNRLYVHGFGPDYV